VADKITSIRGPGGTIYTFTAFVPPKGDDLLVFVVCPKTGDCTLVDRRGNTYPDMQSYVDGSDEFGPDDEVIANADPMHPVGNTRGLATYTKSKGFPLWAWFAIGGAVVLVAAGAVWLLVRRRGQAGSPTNSAIDSTE
jgi:hypothetical protein